MQPQPYNPTGLPSLGSYPPPQGTPQGQAPPEAPVTVGSNKPKLPIALLALLSTVAFVAGVGVGYVLPRATKTTTPTPTRTTTSTAVMADPAITTILTGLAEQINGGSIEQSSLAPHYQMAGQDYATAADQKDSFTIRVEKAKDQVDSTLNVIAAYFTSKGYNEALVANDKTTYYVKYSNSTLLCGSERRPGSVPSQTSIRVSCAMKTSYKKNAEVQAPFYTAYTAAKKANPSLAFPPLLSMPSIADSRSAGYKTAELTAQDEAGSNTMVARFYQTPDQVWNFLATSNEELGCNAYGTPDSKKAYLGEPCFNEATKLEDTVKLN